MRVMSGVAAAVQLPWKNSNRMSGSSTGCMMQAWVHADCARAVQQAAACAGPGQLYNSRISISGGYTVSEASKAERNLRHELANAKQEQIALKGMLKRAADELDHVVEENCSNEAKLDASVAASRLRRAASS